MADADAKPFTASLDRLKATMATLAAAQASMDSNLSQLRFAMTQAFMLFKLDLIILKPDIMIFRQGSPFPSSVQPPPSSPSPSSPAPPSNAYSYHPSQYPPPPRPHVPPP